MKQFFKPIKDVVLILADAKDPKDYLYKMRRREPELAKGWGQIVHPLVVRTPGGPSEMNFEDIYGHVWPNKRTQKRTAVRGLFAC